VLFVGISTLVFAKTEKMMNETNEYNGKTLVVTYSPGDREYKQGKSRSISYFDSKGRIVKEESFSTDELARKGGLFKLSIYYDSNGKLSKVEGFFTEESARKDGLSKGITYYDSNGKKVKETCYDSEEKTMKCP
jgi:hypothetical protein